MPEPVNPRPTPIFVLGLQRSGTTWLANVISQHSRIVAVQSQDHFGILASIIFSHFAPAYGDLNDESNFRQFVTDFAASDYYRVSGLDPAWLATVQARSYHEILRVMMEEVVRQRGGDLWLEKSPVHTALADELAAAYPDARFICVVRRPKEAAASLLWLHRPQQWERAPIRVLLSVSLLRSQQRLLKHFCRQHQDRCFLTRYEDLVADTEAETRRACEFLGVDYEPAMLHPPWRRNTSFNSVDRRRALTLSERFVIAAAGAALNVAPIPVLRSLGAWRRARYRARKGIIFPDWTWRRRDAELSDPARDREQELTNNTGMGDIEARESGFSDR